MRRLRSAWEGAALQMMAILGAIVLVVLGGMLIYYQSQGGYSRVTLSACR